MTPTPDNPPSLHETIRDEGIEHVLLVCVEYAESMAKFYGGLNDADNHRYWVKVWWQLQSACDGIVTNDGLDAALLEWEHYQTQRSTW